ncbi:hypothetical protein DL96DRAFT_1613236 [Flagelloscypha sp. PMI_526]|nr:hypothetical protein DL96DRAFT_1613236 [Flagelloscypha sp. PMI_526]
MISSQSSLSGLLPPEILENVIIFTADSNNHAVSLKLCTISRLFYESTVKRLYHTIKVQKGCQLEEILRTSALQKPWVASCVRVLLITCTNEFPRELVTQALMRLTGLFSLCLLSLAAIDENCSLPHLRRLVQTYTGLIHPRIAPRITHLYLFGDSNSLISQILRQKDTLGDLTHLLVVNAGVSYGTQATQSSLDILQANVPHGLPESLKALVIFANLEYVHPTNSADKILFEKMQGVMNADSRIVFWKHSIMKAPASWTGPRLLGYTPQGNLIDECLGAMPDGKAGLWEAVDHWMADCDTAKPYS